MLLLIMSSWAEQKTEKKKCKIRKRVCLSSPSSFVRKYRFKKPPTWKMSTKSKSHSSKLSTDDIVNRSPSCSVNKGKEEEEEEGGGGGGGGGSVSWKLKKNSEVVEEKSRELVSEISETYLSDPDRSVKNTKTTEVSFCFFFFFFIKLKKMGR